MHVLIVRPGAIGDSLLTFPILEALRTRYKDCTITYVGNSAVLPLISAASLADETFDYGSLMWSELFASSGLHSMPLKTMMQRVDYAICWLRDSDGIVQRNLQSQRIKHIVVAPGRPANEDTIHIVSYLAQTIGIVDSVASSYHLQLKHETTDDEVMVRKVQTVRPFAIHPGSGGALKCWPVSHFAAIIRAIWQHGIPVLLLAGPADDMRVAQLLDLTGTSPKESLLTRLTNVPLLDVAAQLQQCRGYLGNDSGITHLAAMLNIPTLALFGPSNSAIWHPIGSHVTIIHELKLESLSVDMVMSYVENMLRE